MEKYFFCNGKKDFCTAAQCDKDCRHFDGSGGVYRETPKTNADCLDAMTIEEKADFISSIAYGRATPWCEPFAEKFCKSCPETKCEIPDYLNPLFLHECDFTDGKCPHGSDIVWWLQQPSEAISND